jgi:hypothetical protein
VAAQATPGGVSYCDPTAAEDGYWQFDWLDAAPGDVIWHRPLVRIETRAADGGWVAAETPDGPIDDQRWALGVTHLGPGPHGAHRYAARWYTPYLGPGAPYRFAIADPAGGWRVASTPLR